VTTTLADKVDIRFLSTQKAGGFVGVVIGPYAVSGGD
jgi:alpha-N-arabinofuranosidase